MKYFNIRNIGKNQKIEIIHSADLSTERELTIGRVVRVLPNKLILDYDGKWTNKNLLLEFCYEGVKDINII